MAIEITIDGAVAVITMDDGKANVAGTAFLTELDGALDQAEAEASAVVLAGRPNVFSAGYDLKVMAAGDVEALGEMLATGERVVRRFLGLAMPTVTVATGHAIALGALFYLAGDVRVSERGEHRFQLNETANNMVLPDYGVEICRSRLTPGTGFAMAVASVPFDPDQALAAGIATELTAEGAGMATAMERAAALAELPTDVYATTKSAMLRDR